MGRKLQHVPFVELASIRVKNVPVIDIINSKNNPLKKKLEIASGGLVYFSNNGSKLSRAIASDLLRKINEVR